MACLCPEQVSPVPGKDVWVEERPNPGTAERLGRRQPSVPPRPLTPAPQTSCSGTGSWEIADRSRPREGLSRARPRAGPACSQRFSSSLGTDGDPRADAQTDRRRGAGPSPAAPGVCESKEGRTPITLSPCSARQGSTERGSD